MARNRLSRLGGGGPNRGGVRDLVGHSPWDGSLAPLGTRVIDAAPRAVLDTSVLVPTWSRPLLSTLAAARPIVYTPIWCEWIIAETWRVLTVRRLRHASTITAVDERQLSTSANAMLTALLQVMTFESVVPPI